MLQFEELKLQLEGMEADIKDLANALGLDKMKMEKELIKRKMLLVNSLE